MSASVKTAGDSPEAVPGGTVLFYTMNSDRSEAKIQTVTVKDGEAQLSGTVTALRDGLVVGARYMVSKTGNAYYAASDSDEVELKADQYVKLTYELYGGVNSPDNPDPLILTPDSDPVTLSAPVKEGCEFAGWVLNGSYVTEIDPKKVTEDGVISATWRSNSYSIKYNLDGGKFKGSLTGITASTIRMNVPLRRAVKEGYTFAGWYFDSEHTKPVGLLAQGRYIQSDGSYQSSGTGITLYAAWEPVAGTPEPSPVPPGNNDPSEDPPAEKTESTDTGETASENSSTAKKASENSSTAKKASKAGTGASVTSGSTSGTGSSNSEPKKKNVRTGDAANALIWVVIGGAALAGIAGTVIVRKKKK